MMRHITMIFLSMAAVLSLSGSAEAGDCTENGIRLHGRVKEVNAFPDLKVQVVRAFPDIKVKLVDAFPDRCGEWQMVDSMPDFTIQFVTAFPDLKIQYVDAFPSEVRRQRP
jgi:hypothetical protein